MKLGNNSKMVVLGKGNIRLRNVGVTQVITDVFYIPELKNNMEHVESIIPRKGLLCKQDVHIACKNFVESSHLLPNNS